MKIDDTYNYEEEMLSLEEVLDLIEEALQWKKPLSLTRFGHLELAYLGWEYFPKWTKIMEPFSYYSGATASVAKIKDDLWESLRKTNVVGFHSKDSRPWEDRKTAELTADLLNYTKFKPDKISSAWVTHKMIENKRFWSSIQNVKVALVGRRATLGRSYFEGRGINVTYAGTLEGYEDIERIYKDLCDKKDWDIAFVSAGIPAKVLTPTLAEATNKVVIDFGHALDRLIEGEKYDYQTVFKGWKKPESEEILVSIVMSIYGQERNFKEAIVSTLAQTYKKIELIIISNDSNKGLNSILEEINDDRVKVISLDSKEYEAAEVLNIGIRNSRGAWIAIHDVAAIYHPTKIEAQVRHIKKYPHLVGVGTLVNSEETLGVNKNQIISRQKIRNNIHYFCPFVHSSVMFSKDTFQEVGGYNSQYKYFYDFDLWLRMLTKGEMEKVPKVLCQNRGADFSLHDKDGVEALNELQLASTRAICSTFEKVEEPVTLVVIGSQNACENFRANIAPYVNLIVDRFIYKDWRKNSISAVKRVLREDADGIIVLTHRKGGALESFIRKHLKLNKQAFFIYSKH